MDFEKIVSIFFGIASAVAKYLRTIGAITDDDLGKFSGIFGKITNFGKDPSDVESI